MKGDTPANSSKTIERYECKKVQAIFSIDVSCFLSVGYTGNLVNEVSKSAFDLGD